MQRVFQTLAPRRRAFRLNPGLAVLLASLVLFAACDFLTGARQEEETNPDTDTVISITNQTSAKTVTEGDVSGTLDVTASATPYAALSYQWYESRSANNSGGTIIPGAVSASFTIPAGLAKGTYYYYCVVSASGTTASRASTAAIVTVIANENGGAPYIHIDQQPNSITVTQGMITESLSVGASVVNGGGNYTLSYQWYGRSVDFDSLFEPSVGKTAANESIPTDLGIGVYETYCVISAVGLTPVQSDTVTITVTENGSGGNEGNENSVRSQIEQIMTTAVEGGSYTVNVTADEDLDPINLYFNNGSNITITLTGGDEERTLRLLPYHSGGSIFYINPRVTLVLGANVTLQGDNRENNLVIVHGTLKLQEGARITGSNSGGVYVADYGTFNMTGGVISGNTASSNGGGVYVGNYGTFTMTGGVISGNSAGSNGGGVYVHRNGTFAKTGGIIYGASETGVDGDGLPLANNASGSGKGHAAAWGLVYYRDANLGETYNLGTDSEANWTMVNDAAVAIEINHHSVDNPAIINQSAEVLAGVNKLFEISGGTEARWVTWEWSVNGEIQPGATSSTYTFNQPAGLYELFVVVTDETGEQYSGSCLVKAL